MPVKIAATGEESPTSAEQRCSNRLNFHQPQRIAFYAGGPIPPPEAFFVVPFFDISQGGFSYLADTIPERETLIVAMQVHDEVILMHARIVHHRPRGERHLMGCQFSGRVNLAALSD